MLNLTVTKYNNNILDFHYMATRVSTKDRATDNATILMYNAHVGCVICDAVFTQDNRRAKRSSTVVHNITRDIHDGVLLFSTKP